MIYKQLMPEITIELWFLFSLFRWDNSEAEKMGPWDLEPVDEDRKFWIISAIVITKQN